MMQGTYSADAFEQSYKRKRKYAEKYSRKNQDRRLIRRLLTVISVMAVIILTMLVILFVFARRSSASADDIPQYKYYTSVEADQGDSLWNIASDHMSAGYHDVNDLVGEIADINHLSSDHIEAGQKIIVPYYSTEYKN